MCPRQRIDPASGQSPPPLYIGGGAHRPLTTLCCSFSSSPNLSLSTSFFFFIAMGMIECVAETLLLFLVAGI